MMNAIKTFFKNNKSIILSIVISLISIVALVTGLLAFQFSIVAALMNEDSSKWVEYGIDVPRFVFLTWVSFGVEIIALGLSDLVKVITREKKKSLRLTRLANSIILIIIGTLVAILRGNGQMITAACAIVYASGFIYRVVRVVFSRKKRAIASGILIGAINVVLFIATISDPDFFGMLMISSLLLAFLGLLDVMFESFSRIHFTTLKDIVKRTYAFEILLGLVFLIVAFSFVFWVIDGVAYTDALWYCFAVVTTIGFGDVSVTSPISRVLSVILGIYGIIVVALITSIIVNFYNESKYVGKKNGSKKDDKEEIEEQKEEPSKEEDNKE